KRVQVERLRGDESLALARLHLGDVALVEDDPAHRLDVEDALSQGALAGLADCGEGLEDELVERLAVLQALPELGGLPGQGLVGELLEVGLEGGDVRRLLLEALDT